MTSKIVAVLCVAFMVASLHLEPAAPKDPSSPVGVWRVDSETLAAMQPPEDVPEDDDVAGLVRAVFETMEDLRVHLRADGTYSFSFATRGLEDTGRCWC